MLITLIDLPFSVSPVVAGLIISASDLGMTFLFNALSYLAMIVALLYMKPRPRARTAAPRSVLPHRR